MAGFHDHRQYDSPQKCKAYSAFYEVLVSIREKYKELNPKTGLVCGTDKDGPLASSNGPPSETVMEFLRGGIISTMAAWEAYVHDLLEEAFERVLELGQGDLSLLKEKWHRCETVIQDAFDKRVAGEYGDKKLPAGKVAFELMKKPAPWEDLLKDERDHGLRQLQPVFGGPNGIDNIFERMFIRKEKKAGKEDEKEKSISQRVVNFGGVNYRFRHAPIPDGEVQVEIRDIKTLNHILRLYYGVRCVFAHGQRERTINEGGVLQKFPDALIVTKEASVKLIDLYKRIKEHGRRAHVNYFILVNMNRFILNVARLLFKAIAQWFFESFHISMWGYRPDLQEPAVGYDDDDY
jgi:hypothetical protein